MQHVHMASTVVSSFSQAKCLEEERLVTSMKSLKHAGITAVFTGHSKVEERGNGIEILPAEEANVVEIDLLVPTHDEKGQPIAEWKRQVMVRKLQARLLDEEDKRRQDNGSKYMEMEGWRYSQVHNAILSPFGELLSEDDLDYLEKQIENISMQKRCQAYELELSRLAEELRAILPAPIFNISVNTQLWDPNADGQIPLPVWCSRISGIVTSMSQLLTNLTEKGKDGKICKMQGNQLESVFSQQPTERHTSMRGRRENVENEIRQFGVSVQDLRSNFESQIGGHFHLTASIGGGQLAQNMQEEQVNSRTEEAVEIEDLTFLLDQSKDCGIVCEELPREVNHPVRETTTLRKERIVVLFLSHWKRSAYALTMRGPKYLEGQASSEKTDQNILKKIPEVNQPTETTRNRPLCHFIRQRTAINKMISKWKNIVSCVPTRQIRHLNRPRIIHSPEQFLPCVNGVPLDYDSLTLDLFLLGYFHILEQELPADERKMRHLLCFEVFDHVGRFSWETVRNFHRAVLQDIEAGKREWIDGFEDIKFKYFGDMQNQFEPPCYPGRHLQPEVRPVPQVIVQNATPEDGDFLRRGGVDISCFSNDDICKYIDRSFAFWKEKEAEIFDFVN